MADITFWRKEEIIDGVYILKTPQDVISTYPNYQDQDGRWIMNVEQNQSAMLALGFVQMTQAELDAWNTAHPAPVITDQIRTKCTKYQLVTCLKKHFPQLLASLRTAYSQNTDLQFYWNSVLDLERGNEDFIEAISQLGISSEQLDDIFSKIEGEV